MSRAQLTACLVVVVLMACVQYSHGFEGEFRSNCTKNSDCKFDNSHCYKSDLCKMGQCYCKKDYKYGNNRYCMKLRKIGETCDLAKEACYGGHSACRGVCACDRGYKVSEDKTTCVGRKFGETCYDYKNHYWEPQKCEQPKGLRCNTTTHTCVCARGLKENGDHCEKPKEGDRCEENDDCDDRYAPRGYLCVGGTCSCGAEKREYTYKSRDNYGVEYTHSACVSNEAKVYAVAGATCTKDNSGFSRAGKEDVLCGDFLTCGRCIESMNEWNNSTKICLPSPSSAVHLSLNVAAVFGLLVLLLLVKPN